MKRKSIFLIKWRNRAKTMIVQTSVSHFLTRESAQKQIDWLSRTWPQNSYYVETAQ